LQNETPQSPLFALTPRRQNAFNFALVYEIHRLAYAYPLALTILLNSLTQKYAPSFTGPLVVPGTPPTSHPVDISFHAFLNFVLDRANELFNGEVSENASDMRIWQPIRLFVVLVELDE